MIIYFASWLLLIVRPDAAWSRSAAGLLAPAYTPLIWLAGIALVGGSWPYELPSLRFVGRTSITTSWPMAWLTRGSHWRA
jgi:hypothetical protein